MNVLAVTLTPWAKARILRDHTSGKTTKVTKAALKKSLVAFPGTEFHTIGGVMSRAGAVVTVQEAVDSGVEMLEVRHPNMELLAAIYLTDGKVVVA